MVVVFFVVVNIDSIVVDVVVINVDIIENFIVVAVAVIVVFVIVVVVIWVSVSEVRCGSKPAPASTNDDNNNDTKIVAVVAAGGLARIFPLIRPPPPNLHCLWSICTNAVLPVIVVIAAGNASCYIAGASFGSNVDVPPVQILPPLPLQHPHHQTPTTPRLHGYPPTRASMTTEGGDVFWDIRIWSPPQP